MWQVLINFMGPKELVLPILKMDDKKKEQVEADYEEIMRIR